MKTKTLTLFMISMLAFVSLSPMLLIGSTGQDIEAPPEFALGKYHSYLEIKAELERISTEYPEIASLSVLGQTWEGRDIMALRLTDNPSVTETGEPAILIMGGHHGNELASVEVPMRILGFLADNYAINLTVRELVDSRDIWFVPMVNPDGREHTLETGTGWRKNRRPIDVDGDGASDGIGADLNRNYGHLWGELPGTSHDPASTSYCGPEAFSENETQAIRNLALSVNFSISLSYHTYGDVIYYPWNNNIDILSPRAELLEAIAQDIAQLTGYSPMQGVEAYPTTGDSNDWQYADTYCLPFTVEMGTTHAIPPGEIEALADRNLPGALHAIELAGEPEKALLPDWTFMVYMSADADQALANEAVADLNEMESTGSSQSLNIIALHDGNGNGDSRLYRVLKDPGGLNPAIISETLDDQGAVIPPSKEMDMSDPRSLNKFVEWTIANYPAQRYALVLWGHGDGVIRGFIPDKGSSMAVSEISQALDGFYLDIVGFDTCSMGHFEVASELVGSAGIFIGSEAEEPLSGWAYATTLAALSQTPWMEPRTLASRIVDDYLASRFETYITQAAIDLKAYGEVLVPAIAEFTRVSLDFAYQDRKQIWKARNESSSFLPESDAVDLFQFMSKLNDSSISPHVKSRVARILATKNSIIIRSGAGTLYPESTAMAIYFPKPSQLPSTLYTDLKFLDTGWGNYLVGIINPSPRSTIIPGPPPSGEAGPYNITALLNGTGGRFILNFRVDSGTWQSADMALQDGILAAEIPAQPNGTFVQYYFLDAASNVTEPYEVNFGSQDYISFWTSAACDIEITAVSVADPGNLTVGEKALIRINITNNGLSPARADIVCTIQGSAGNITIGTAAIDLEPGQSASMWLNWTAVQGNWSIMANATSATFDTDLENNAMRIHLQVAAVPVAGILEDYWPVIMLLAVMWVVAVAIIVLMLRKARARRRSGAIRALESSRQFLVQAEALGVDISRASTILARAEAALATSQYRRFELLLREARESAMESVGMGNKSK